MKIAFGSSGTHGHYVFPGCMSQATGRKTKHETEKYDMTNEHVRGQTEAFDMPGIPTCHHIFAQHQVAKADTGHIDFYCLSYLQYYMFTASVHTLSPDGFAYIIGCRHTKSTSVLHTLYTKGFVQYTPRLHDPLHVLYASFILIITSLKVSEL